nr:type II toxin-antitoxin system VapC family toxin [Desulfobacterales bacterium]
MKRLLLDTCVFLWWLTDEPSMAERAKAAIADPLNQVYVSAATTWEISIKKTLGKLDAPDDLERIVEEEYFIKLPISLYHGEMAGRLPSHHPDPFDRMLIAQAQAEGLTIVTGDKRFARYGVKILWAR